MMLNWNFQRGGEVLEKFPSMGRYGYFLELRNSENVLLTSESGKVKVAH